MTQQHDDLGPRRQSPAPRTPLDSAAVLIVVRFPAGAAGATGRGAIPGAGAGAGAGPAADAPRGGRDPLDAARAALSAFASRPGFVGGRFGRSTETDGGAVLVCEWESVGAWRRAQSGYAVKVAAAPLWALARDEPGAFEVLLAAGPAGLVEYPSDRAADGGR
jgi:hypothetical protein